MTVATIRAAEPADARAIAQVHVASWRWAYADDLPQAVLDVLSVDERQRMWREAIEDLHGAVEVADHEGRVVGFVSTGPTRDDDAADGTGELFAIYLDKAAAGTGVGAALLERAELDLRGQGSDARPCGCSHRTHERVASTNATAGRGTARPASIRSNARTDRSCDTSASSAERRLSDRVEIG
jgi:L-amino acid N-acyltransferase YncA